jgi:hypothetical protein
LVIEAKQRGEKEVNRNDDAGFKEGIFMTSVPFCSCPDHACPRNPVNHDKGCVLCVAKCLHENEIPTCFYRKIEPDMDRKQDYSFQGFARFVQKRIINQEEEADQQ